MFNIITECTKFYNDSNKIGKRVNVTREGDPTVNAATGRTPPPDNVTPGAGRPAGPIKPTDPGRRAYDAAAAPASAAPGVCNSSSNLW